MYIYIYVCVKGINMWYVDVSYTPPKFTIEPEKWWFPKGISFSRDFFSGSMLNFWGVSQKHGYHLLTSITVNTSSNFHWSILQSFACLPKSTWTSYPNFAPQHVDVSQNRGTPKSSILIGFSTINHPFWGTTIFGNTHVFTVFKNKKANKNTPPWNLQQKTLKINVLGTL